MTVEQVLKTEPVKEIAKRVVNECLRVKTDEQVNVFSFPHTIDYANAIALEIEKAGGVSTMLLESDDFFWGYLSEVPESQYARKQRALLALLDESDIGIGLGGPKDPSGFTKVSGERLNKMMAGEREIGDKVREKKIRNMSLPIGLVTQERARTYGFDYNQWRVSMTHAMNVDHNKISALGKTIGDKLAKASNVQVTAPNGTDFKFRLIGRPVHLQDGIIDDKDIANGTLEESLPSGTVEAVPDESSGEGKIVFDQPTALRGKMLQGFRVTFEKGKLTQYNAVANLDAFQGMYEPATGDKDKLAQFAIGLNPNASLIGFFNDRTVMGTVSIAIGGNKSRGGTNETSFGHEQTLRKPTVELDGQKIVVDGRIQV